jgi:hypothetical protein
VLVDEEGVQFLIDVVVRSDSSGTLQWPLYIASELLARYFEWGEERSTRSSHVMTGCSWSGPEALVRN